MANGERDALKYVKCSNGAKYLYPKRFMVGVSALMRQTSTHAKTYDLVLGGKQNNVKLIIYRQSRSEFIVC